MMPVRYGLQHKKKILLADAARKQSDQTLQQSDLRIYGLHYNAFSLGCKNVEFEKMYMLI